MLRPRLVLFCSELDLDLDKVRHALSSLGEDREVEGLELEEVEAPESLSSAGWMAVAVRPMRGRGMDVGALEGHLEALVGALADALSDDALGIYADPVAGYANACFHRQAGSPRGAEGELSQVLRQAASWVEGDDAELTRYFRPDPASDADPAKAPPPAAGEKELDAEEDDDDRYVEAKLRQARHYMEQYLGSRKQPPDR